MSHVIDLTLEDEEEDAEIHILKPSIIPFINYTRVPENFVPVCPSSNQSFQSSFELEKRGKKQKLSHLLVTDTLASLDNGIKKIPNFEQNVLDLDKEIFSSGKLYFLNKLFEHISRHENLTDTQLLILTSELSTEKLIFRICNENFGHPCIRLSRQQEYKIFRSKDNFAGAKFGVLIRFTAAPFKAKHLLDMNIKHCNMSLVEFIIIFDGDVLPNFLKIHDVNKQIFNEEPNILNLCTIGTSEFRFKEYISRSPAFDKTSMEIFIHHANEEMYYRFMGHNSPYSSIDFLNWNNHLAKQLAHWIMTVPSIDYNFAFPFVKEGEILKELEY